MNDSKVTTPAAWKTCPLGEVTTIGSGSGFPTKYQGKLRGQYPFYKVSDMNLPGNEVWMRTHNNAIDEQTRAELKAKTHPPGTIIFPKIGAAIATNKKRILSQESCFDNNVIGIHPSSEIDTRFLYQYLVSQDLSDFANSGNPPSIRKTTLETWEIPLPSFAEQKRVAEILDATDALRAKRRETVALLDTLLQSTFHDMFGDPVTNPMGWEIVKIGDIGSVQGGLQVTSKRRSLPLERPYLRVANVFRGYLDLAEIKTIRLTEAEERRTALEDGDLLIVEGHGNKKEIGRCARWDGSIEPCVHQNHLIRFRCNRARVLPAYLESFMNSEGGRRELAGTSRTTSGLNTISVSKVKATSATLPPLDLQHRFAAAVDSVEQQRVHHRAHLTELDTLFASLQSRAFSGDL